ncbi:MAG: hypothetical protein AAFZ87_00175 [Planctomycetota bacterium]
MKSAEILKRDADAALDRIDADGTLRKAAEHVIDLDAESSACPACGESIPRGHRRCPGCGLRLG